MAKGGFDYFNPDIPFVKENRKLADPWRRWLQDVDEQANAFINLVTDVTGILTVGNGGTGRATLTDTAVLLGNGSAAVSFAAPSTSGFVLTDNGPGVDPSFQAVPGTADDALTMSWLGL